MLLYGKYFLFINVLVINYSKVATFKGYLHELYKNISKKCPSKNPTTFHLTPLSETSSGHAINFFEINDIDVSEMYIISEHAQKPMVSDITDGYFG